MNQLPMNKMAASSKPPPPRYSRLRLHLQNAIT